MEQRRAQNIIDALWCLLCQHQRIGAQILQDGKLWGARVTNANTSHIRDLLELMEPLTEDEMRKTA